MKNQYNSLCILIALIGIAMLTMVTTANAAETKLPNIVIFYMDDLGYADIGPFGSKIPTPHLDRMAAEGMRFTNFNVTSPVCTASRAGLMTGALHQRISLNGALGPGDRRGLHPDEVTIASLVKPKGYATAVFGKWHLGHHPPFLPLSHGFDEFFGIPYSNDMWPYHPNPNFNFPPLPLFEGMEIINAAVSPDDQKLLTTQFTERAVDFIKRPQDQPFFVYLPHPQPHVPLFVSDKFAGKSEQGLYGDVIMEIDWSIGQVLDTLRELELDRNTLVIVSSDNGPWLSYGKHAGSAYPLREGKGTSFEGGVRVPTLFWMPGKIPAGTTQDQFVATIDILPTIAHLIGASLPERKIDGHDIRPLMFGEPGAVSPHTAFPIHYNARLEAIRDHRWKVVFSHSYRGIEGEGRDDGLPVPYRWVPFEIALFDLENDIGETTDVSQRYPEVFARLKAAADRFRAELGDGRAEGPGVRPPGRVRQDGTLE